MEGIEGDVKNLLRYRGSGTVEVHTWISEVPYDAFKKLVQACKEFRLEEEHLPQWEKKTIVKIWSQVLENDFMKSIKWKSTDFLRPAFGEVEEEPLLSHTSVNTARLFLVDDFLCWLTANQQEESRERLVVRSLRETTRLKKAEYDWRNPNRLLTLQIGDTRCKNKCFSQTYGPPDGECDTSICALKLTGHQHDERK